MLQCDESELKIHNKLNFKSLTVNSVVVIVTNFIILCSIQSLFWVQMRCREPQEG